MERICIIGYNVTHDFMIFRHQYRFFPEMWFKIFAKNIVELFVVYNSDHD